ncbi:MAG: hypothetical protein U0804_16935 [Gemmataceae bacterium]
MARGVWLGWAAAVCLTGCATAPPADNPTAVRGSRDDCENPVLVSPGQPTAASYREVFEKCIEVVDDYFQIAAANPHAGVIITTPRIAPGFEQIWKGGNPDPRERLLATLQTIRQTAVVTIRTGERGGYLVEVVVEKELEDLPRPSRQSVGAVFQEAPTVDRGLEVIPAAAAAPTTGTGWFRVGRDFALEQQLLRRIQSCR